MEPFSIELIEAIELKCSKRGVCKMLDKITRKHQLQNTNSDIQIDKHVPRYQTPILRTKVVHLTSWTLYVCLLHVHFTFAFF